MHIGTEVMLLGVIATIVLILVATVS